jgi:hypothetical protein
MAAKDNNIGDNSVGREDIGEVVGEENESMSYMI